MPLIAATSQCLSLSLSLSQPVSSTLRARLHKAKRSFNSPFLVPKRLRIHSHTGGAADPTTAQSGVSGWEQAHPQHAKPPSLHSPRPGPPTLGTCPKADPPTLGTCPKADPPTLGTCPKADPPTLGTCPKADPPTLGISPKADPPTLGISPKAAPPTLGLCQTVAEALEHRLLEEKQNLEQEVREKEELLRRLMMVKMYRLKNQLGELCCLTGKWRASSQNLLYELQTVLSAECPPSLAQLLDSMGLDEQLLHYNRVEDNFTTAAD
uniref:Swi5-dependent recombination DNA repair protein 1 homolog n=2 Tax=Callorhinchus milii TaxID=7868 RepID=A0A4W3GVJ6_CALMI|eukprot:gi/632988655/ref/XP_007883228.1/ PREDICTED: swi5-dependent recombination DNA repair protein 1 homolog isoform X1 [Callorhinchus milii]